MRASVFTVSNHLQPAPNQSKSAKNNSGAIGREFESLRAHQSSPPNLTIAIAAEVQTGQVSLLQRGAL